MKKQENNKVMIAVHIAAKLSFAGIRIVIVFSMALSLPDSVKIHRSEVSAAPHPRQDHQQEVGAQTPLNPTPLLNP